ncbi:MAG: hypothetical protein M1828_000493, partial [Chrysothrix sp. TS-e1954]
YVCGIRWNHCKDGGHCSKSLFDATEQAREQQRARMFPYSQPGYEHIESYRRFLNEAIEASRRVTLDGQNLSPRQEEILLTLGRRYRTSQVRMEHPMGSRTMLETFEEYWHELQQRGAAQATELEQHDEQQASEPSTSAFPTSQPSDRLGSLREEASLLALEVDWHHRSLNQVML